MFWKSERKMDFTSLKDGDKESVHSQVPQEFMFESFGDGINAVG